MKLHNALCDLLEIEYPILQSGMRRVAGPELAAQVSNAGGLGILAGLLAKGEDLRAQIRGRLRGRHCSSLRRPRTSTRRRPRKATAATFLSWPANRAASSATCRERRKA